MGIQLQQRTAKSAFQVRFRCELRILIEMSKFQFDYDINNKMRIIYVLAARKVRKHVEFYLQCAQGKSNIGYTLVPLPPSLPLQNKLFRHQIIRKGHQRVRKLRYLAGEQKI
jgi:hypothetical protein